MFYYFKMLRENLLYLKLKVVVSRNLQKIWHKKSQTKWWLCGIKISVPKKWNFLSIFWCVMDKIWTEFRRNHTCKKEESSSSDGDAGLGGRVVVSHLSALHAHYTDDDANKAQQYWDYHEGTTCLDVDWVKVKNGGSTDGRGEKWTVI